MSRHRRWMSAATLLALVCLVPGPTIRAQNSGLKFEDLLKRVPQGANLILLVDVDGLLNSPLGQREDWRSKAASRTSQSLWLSPDDTKAVVSANFDLFTFQENWKVGLVEVREALPDLETLAAREGGFVESVQNTKATWTPRGFYLFSLPPNTVGFAAPAERQKLGNWLRQVVIQPRKAPPAFADQAVYRAEKGSQIVVAIDLNGAVAPQLAEPWLNTIKGVASAKLDPKLLAARLASAKSAFLQIDVTQNITGTLRVDFDLPVDYATIVMKDILLTLLDNYGTSLPELDTWTPQVDGKTVELSGRLSAESVAKILSLGRPPELTPRYESLGNTPPPRADQPTPAAPAPPEKADIVKASQQYFRSVTDLLDGLKSQKFTNYSSAKTWYDRYAKQMEELPILGVDKDLLDWGSKVARTLREMSMGITGSVAGRKYELAGQPNGYGGYAYGGYGYYSANSTSYDQAVLKRQGDAALGVSLTQRWQVLDTTIADMRRAMTEKYQVDF